MSITLPDTRIGLAAAGVAMKIELVSGINRNMIRAYGPGRITVNNVTYATSLLVMPDRVISGWSPETFDQLVEPHFAAIAALEPEVVVLGTGRRLRFPHPGATAPLARANIGIEVMDTGAACRTYNILMSEDRRVVAALLMIEDY